MEYPVPQSLGDLLPQVVFFPMRSMSRVYGTFFYSHKPHGMVFLMASLPVGHTGSSSISVSPIGYTPSWGRFPYRPMESFFRSCKPNGIHFLMRLFPPAYRIFFRSVGSPTYTLSRDHSFRASPFPFLEPRGYSP